MVIVAIVGLIVYLVVKRRRGGPGARSETPREGGEPPRDVEPAAEG